MGYKVIRKFTDSTDDKRLYEVGQTYPRAGVEVTQERIDYLLNKDEDFERPFIKYVEEPTPNVQKPDTPSEFPKHTGGGWYELSNGEKIQGKEEAQKAENDLKGGE